MKTWIYPVVTLLCYIATRGVIHCQPTFDVKKTEECKALNVQRLEENQQRLHEQISQILDGQRNIKLQLGQVINSTTHLDEVKPTAECEDIFCDKQSCIDWATRGVCQTNPSYMNHYCRKSCNACTDDKIQQCPTGYFGLFMNTSCYRFIKSQTPLFNAIRLCKDDGANLVAIETEEEDDYLNYYITRDPEMNATHIWLGGNDIYQEGKWIWTSTWKPFNTTFTDEKWAPGEPNNHKSAEHCLLLTCLNCEHAKGWHGGKWNDIPCEPTSFETVIPNINFAGTTICEIQI